MYAHIYDQNYGVGLLSMKEGKFLPVCPQVIMSVYSYQNKQLLGNRKPFKSECEMNEFQILLSTTVTMKGNTLYI